MGWFKIEKEYVMTVYCHPAYLTSMQSISCRMSGWMNHKLESRLMGEISITWEMQMIPLFLNYVIISFFYNFIYQLCIEKAKKKKKENTPKMS